MTDASRRGLMVKGLTVAGAGAIGGVGLAKASGAKPVSPTGPAGNDPFKIGFVDFDRVLAEAQPAKVAQQRLEREFSRREKALDQEGERLKNAYDQFDRDSPGLSVPERGRRERSLAQDDRAYQVKRRSFQDDLAQRKNEELSSVIQRANAVMKQIFDREKFDLILQEAVFASPRIDVTQKVIDGLNSATAG